MDWNLKKPTWDLTKFNQETIPNMDLVDGSSSFGGQEADGNFSVDLKLGRMSHFGDESGDKLVQQQQQQRRQLVGVSKMASSSSPSGSSKRAKAYNNATQTVSCLVDGCTSDLNNCREYHRRHKVCELHSKTPQVTIGGQKQRFCQQCSRFHSLEEFDEGKRSCRKRLAGHNQRRRKPQPEPMLNSGSYLSNYQGARLFPLSSSHIYPTTSIVSPSWVGAVKTVEDAGVNNHQQPRLNLFDKQNPFSGSYSSSYRGEKQFTFMQGEINPMFSKSVNTASSQSGGGSSSSHRIFSNGLMTDQVPDSDCALSLLSSSPPPMHTSGIGLSHMVQQSIGSNQNYSSLVEPIDSILVSSVSDANVHCQGMFHMGSNESNNNDEPQTLPFYWD